MHAAMDIGILLAVITVDGVDDRLRLLRRGAVIEIDQGPAVHLARKNGKVAAYAVDIKWHSGVLGCDSLAHVNNVEWFKG